MSINISPIKPKIIGLTGTAKSGKDTFFNAFKSLYPSKNIQRLSIADIIRKELDDFIYWNTGINIWNCSPKEKESIRPLMAWYGDFKRKQTEGHYFLHQLDNEIYALSSRELIDAVVITDIRFKEFEIDESDWIKKYSGTLIHIQRKLPNGELVMPVNDLEKLNDPILQNLADWKICWDTFIADPYKNLNQSAQDIIKTLELL